MAQPSVHGRFIWQELLTDNTAAAASFYSKVIGWRVQPAAQADAAGYSVLATEHGTVGGLTSLPDHARDAGARPHWLPYVGAENVDATAAKAERLGGKVLRAAADIENLGRYAVLADPQGATFGIYRPKNPSGAAAKSQPQRGEFAWQELASSDFEAAFRFYADLFGWEALRRMDMGAAGTYLVFGRDGVQQGGIYKLSAQVPAPYWLSYVEVASPEAAADAARAAGGRVAVGPMDVPGGGRIAQLLDPGGVLFAVHAAGRAAEAAGASASTASARAATPAKPAAKPAAKRPAAASPRPAAATSGASASSAPVTSGSSAGAAAPKPRPVARGDGPGSASAPAAKTAETAASSSGSAAPKKAAAKKAAPRKAAKKAAPARAARGGAKRAGKRAAKKAKRPARKAAGRAAGKSARGKVAAKSAKRAGKRVAKKAKRAAGAGAKSARGRRGTSRRGRAGSRR